MGASVVKFVSVCMAVLARGKLKTILFIALTTILNVSFLQATNAHALSDYDNVIQMGGSIGLHLPINSEGLGRCSQPYLNNVKSDDLSASWGNLLLNTANYTNPTEGAAGSAFWHDLIEHPSDYAWSVSQPTNTYGISGYKSVFITAATTRGAEFATVGGTKLLRTSGNNTRSFYIDYYSWGNPNPRCDVHVGYWNNYGKATIAVDGNTNEKFVYINYDITYPQDYEGNVPSDASGDADSDGLTLAQESAIGTSDSDMDGDTDNDGLSDFIESPWNTNRDDQFCDTSTPKNCAYPDPLKKDVYVEMDWMHNGSTDYKPTSTQIGLVISMFNDHNINLHIDAGEYGGGNELTTYESPLLNQPSSTQIDYYDYKSGGNGISSNFASDRAGIWHYMISSNRYTYDVDPADSSGWASVMGSNTFIALGYILDDNSVASQDRAVANTIAHELGHNICLSPTRKYNEQPAQCVYQGIDNGDSGSSYYNLENYESVMNYRYQLTDYDDLGVVKYSEGTNTTNDHDDWSGINSAVGLFNAPRTLYTEFGAGKQRSAVRSNTNTSSNNLDPDGNVVIGENSTPGYSMKK